MKIKKRISIEIEVQDEKYCSDDCKFLVPTECDYECTLFQEGLCWSFKDYTKDRDEECIKRFKVPK